MDANGHPLSREMVRGLLAENPNVAEFRCSLLQKISWLGTCGVLQLKLGPPPIELKSAPSMGATVLGYPIKVVADIPNDEIRAYDAAGNHIGTLNNLRVADGSVCFESCPATPAQ